MKAQEETNTLFDHRLTEILREEYNNAVKVPKSFIDDTKRKLSAKMDSNAINN